VLFLVILVFGSVLLVDQFDRAWVIFPDPSGSAAIFFGFLALILISLRIVHLRTMDYLNRERVVLQQLQSLYGRAQQIMRGLVVGAHFALLFGTAWPEHVRGFVGESWCGLDELLIVLPFVVLFTVGCMRLYPLDRAIREAMMGELLYLSEPVRRIWSRREYVSFQLRFNLLLVGGPLMLIVGAKDLLESRRDWLTYETYSLFSAVGLPKLADLSSEFALAAAAGTVLLISPVLVRLIWYCRSLPEGPLRDQLEALGARTGLRYRDILLWPTYGVIVNAAMVGILGRLRYIMLSDGLIESLPDNQIGAVFAHEIGHVKHHHLPFLMMFAFGSMGLLGLSALTVQNYWQVDPQLIEMGLCGSVVVVWLFLFGYVSRTFERQADVFAAESLSRFFDGKPGGCGHAQCLRHGVNGSASGGDDQPLCMTASDLVCSALDRAAALNAIPRMARTWRHGSVAGRCQAIIHFSHDPGAFADFRGQLWRLKLVIFSSAVLSAVWAVRSATSIFGGG